MLGDKIEHYNQTGEMIKNTPAQYKKEFELLKEVDLLALANAQQNLENGLVPTVLLIMIEILMLI